MENLYNSLFEEILQRTGYVNLTKFLPLAREEPVPNLIGYGSDEDGDGRDCSKTSIQSDTNK